MSVRKAAAAYIGFFENLSPDSLHGLTALCAPEVRFRDPFNDVRGVARFRAVLEGMFRELQEPQFKVLDHAISSRVCYLRWDFTFRRAGGHHALVCIPGMSELHFDAADKVTAHIDHWDAGRIYEMVPVAGAMVRLIRRRLSAD